MAFRIMELTNGMSLRYSPRILQPCAFGKAQLIGTAT